LFPYSKIDDTALNTKCCAREPECFTLPCHWRDSKPL